MDETASSNIPVETTETLALPETTVSDTIDNAFGGTINDAEKARETSSPWGSAPADVSSAPPLESAAPEAAPEMDDGAEEDKPRKGRRALTPEERAERDRVKHERRLREADAYLRAANMFWLGRANAQLKDLLSPDQLSAELKAQDMTDKERGELAEPLAEVLEEEGVETSPTTKLLLIAFSIYAPKMERLKTLKTNLDPNANRSNQP